jgi:hypothetical protein
MGPLNKIVWIKAFRRKQTLVTLPGNMTFNCDYEERPGFVWVSPASNELTPCGWFDLDIVTKQSWIESDKFVRKTNVAD